MGRPYFSDWKVQSTKKLFFTFNYKFKIPWYHAFSTKNALEYVIYSHLLSSPFFHGKWLFKRKTRLQPQISCKKCAFACLYKFFLLCNLWPQDSLCLNWHPVHYVKTFCAHGIVCMSCFFHSFSKWTESYTFHQSTIQFQV